MTGAVEASVGLIVLEETPWWVHTPDRARRLPPSLTTNPTVVAVAKGLTSPGGDVGGCRDGLPGAVIGLERLRGC